MDSLMDNENNWKLKNNLRYPKSKQINKSVLHHYFKTGRGLQGQYRGDAGSFKFCGHGTLSGQPGYRKDPGN